MEEEFEEEVEEEEAEDVGMDGRMNGRSAEGAWLLMSRRVPGTLRMLKLDYHGIAALLHSSPPSPSVVHSSSLHFSSMLYTFLLFLS